MNAERMTTAGRISQPGRSGTEGYVHTDYSRYAPGSKRSAAAVAKCVMERLAPASVLDVGCGTGVWLDAFRNEGVKELHGVDGPWAPAPKRLAPGEFTPINFEIDDPAAATLPRDRYDLVVSLEFLEHVDAARADALVDFLCSKGDVVLASAAIPLQGGQHHVNERWPEYWVAKFRQRGFTPFDVLRLALWDEPAIESWYRQNVILYFRGAVPEPVRLWGEGLAREALYAPSAQVHPEFYAKRLGRILFAIHHPLSFAAMLLREARSGVRASPPIGNVERESDRSSECVS